MKRIRQYPFAQEQISRASAHHSKANTEDQILATEPPEFQLSASEPVAQRNPDANAQPVPQTTGPTGTTAPPVAKDPNDVSQKTDTEVNSIIDAFPSDELKKQIGSKIKNRRNFLTGMQKYIGTLDQVIHHFNNINAANVPSAGRVHLHKKAATRLENVKKTMEEHGMTMPSTTIALGLRGRYKPHSRYSQSKMAHPMGYAIDYRATKNNHVIDPRKIWLIKEATGLSSIQPNLGKSTDQRRKIIRDMGDFTDAYHAGEDLSAFDKDTFSAYLQKVDQEYKTMFAASDKFQQALPQANLDLLNIPVKANREIKAIKKSIKRLERRKGRTRRSKRAPIQQEIDAKKLLLPPLEKQIADYEAKLPVHLKTIFEPWIKKLETEKQKIQIQYPSIDFTDKKGVAAKIEDFKKTKGNLSKLKKNLENAERKKKNNEGYLKKENNRKKPRPSKIKEYETRIESARKKIADLKPKVTAAENAKTGHYDLKEHTALQKIHDGLLSKDFVYGTEGYGKLTARDASVQQLLEVGWFNEDKEPAAGKKPQAHKNGFDLFFMKVMALHGFDQGINWTPGNTDAMHFELVEGVQSIKRVPRKKRRNRSK